MSLLSIPLHTSPLAIRFTEETYLVAHFTWASQIINLLYFQNKILRYYGTQCVIKLVTNILTTARL